MNALTHIKVALFSSRAGSTSLAVAALVAFLGGLVFIGACGGGSAPTAPGYLRLANGLDLPAVDYDPSSTTQVLTWQASAGATSYELEESANGGAWANVATTSNRSASFTQTAAGSYAYRVKACDATNGCGGESSVWTVRIAAAQDETAPSLRSGISETTYSYTYHDAGKTQLATETMDGPRTDLPANGEDETVTTYDVNGNMLSVENALSQTTVMSNHNSRGQPQTITDANNVVTQLTYHPRGWLTSRTVVDPGGNPTLDATTTFGYDAVGQLTQVTLPDGSFLKYEYDDARRLEAIENTLGERIEYTLDNAGNRTVEVICAAGTGGDTGVACDIQKTQTRLFDALSRLRKSVGAANQTERYDYDANDNLEKTTDGKGNEAVQAFDAINRVATQYDPDDTPLDLTNNFKVSYTYDDQDRIDTVTDQRGLVTDYDYDAFGDLTQVLSPDTGLTTYTYDDAGNRVSQTDARAQVTYYRYDALNRLTEVVTVGKPQENIKYTYDETTGGNYGVGRLTKIVDQSGTTEYKYDHRGNVIEKTSTVMGQVFSTSYEYDLADRITKIVLPGHRVVEYTRDTDGRIIDVKWAVSDVAARTDVIHTVSYKPFGPVSGYTFGNGIARSISYDNDYRIVDIDDVNPGGYELDLNYTYDLNNNIDLLNNHGDASKNQDFDYDKLDRLEAADGDYGNIDYDYDGVGNRTSKVHVENGVTTTEVYNYEATSNRLDDIDFIENSLPVGTRGFGYDASGNTIQDVRTDGTTLNLDYNGANRFGGLKKNGATTSVHLYNALGQRAMKATTSGLKYYHYDEAGRIIGSSELEAATTLRAYYLFADDRRVAQVDASGTIQYLHNDHLRRPVAITDGVGSKLLELEYLPFGMVKIVSTGISPTEIFGFPGQILDSESGYFYNYFRDYDPSTGRFVQSDPIGLRGGISTYGYSNGNAVNYIDPTGTVAVVDDVVILAGAAAVAAGVACASTNCGEKIADAITEGFDAVSSYLSQQVSAAKKKGVEKWNKNPPADPGSYSCRYVVYFSPDECKKGCPLFATGRGWGSTLGTAMAQARHEAQNKIPPGCSHQHHGQMWCRYGSNPPFMP